MIMLATDTAPTGIEILETINTLGTRLQKGTSPRTTGKATQYVPIRTGPRDRYVRVTFEIVEAL